MATGRQLAETKSEYESLKEEIRFLRAEIVRLAALRDELNFRECPRIRAEYDARVGELELRVYDARARVQKLKRTIEILQAARNRQEEKTAEEAREDAGKEYRAYEEDLKKKADDIHRSQSYWREEAEKEQAWQEEAAKDQAEKDSAEETQAEENEKNSADGEESSQRADDENEKESGGSEDGEATDEQEGGSGTFHSRAEELRFYYRKLVKALHPDTNPSQTEEEKQMFRDAVEAYRNGDLDRLRELYQNLSASGRAEDFKDTPDDREKMRDIRDTLKARAARLQEEVEHIRSTFPYIAKEFLEDDEAVAARQKELASYLAAYEKQYQELTEVFRKMQEGGSPA